MLHCLNSIQQALRECWRRHPALFPALAFFLGCLTYLQGPHALLPLIPTLLLVLGLSVGWRRSCLFTGILFLAWLYLPLRCQRPPNEAVWGWAKVSFHNIQDVPPNRGGGHIYKGTLLSFYQKDRCLAHHYPVTVVVRKGQQRPPANCEYWIQGRLELGQRRQAKLKSHQPIDWKPVPFSFSLGEARYVARQTYRNWLDQLLSPSLVTEFLAGITSGHFQDRCLLMDFQRVGLRHLLAISGFHFALIALFAGWLLRPFFSPPLASTLLLGLLTAYFLLFSTGPSMKRAWLMLSLNLIGLLMGRPAQALNLLGVCLLLLMLEDPLACQDIGFQFSFLATGAILLLYRPLDDLLKAIFLPRRVSDILELIPWHQALFIAMVNLRRGLALSLAVNSFTLPLALYHFHQFPLLGLLFNLFYPALVTLDLFLLLITLLASWVPLLGYGLKHLTLGFTDYLLGLVHHTPLTWDHQIFVPNLTSETLQILLLGLGIAGIWLWGSRQKTAQQTDWIL